MLVNQKGMRWSRCVLFPLCFSLYIIHPSADNQGPQVTNERYFAICSYRTAAVLYRTATVRGTVPYGRGTFKLRRIFTLDPLDPPRTSMTESHSGPKIYMVAVCLDHSFTFMVAVEVVFALFCDLYRFRCQINLHSGCRCHFKKWYMSESIVFRQNFITKKSITVAGVLLIAGIVTTFVYLSIQMRKLNSSSFNFLFSDATLYSTLNFPMLFF